MFPRRLSAFALMVAVSLLTSGSAVGANDPKAKAFVELLHSLGYTNGIHSFKNLVLRGDEKYRTRANSAYDKANKAIEKLKSLGVSWVVLANVERMILNYSQATEEIVLHRQSGKTAEKVDAWVRVNDGPAMQAIEKLKAEISLDKAGQLVAMLGYGGAIHKFKNYVLRGGSSGGDKHFKASKELFKKARSLSMELGAYAVTGTVDEYLTATDVAKDLYKNGGTASQIDGQIKISDSEARAELESFIK